MTNKLIYTGGTVLGEVLCYTGGDSVGGSVVTQGMTVGGSVMLHKG